MNCADLSRHPNSRLGIMLTTYVNIAVVSDNMTCLTICRSAQIVDGLTMNLCPTNPSGGQEVGVTRAKRIPLAWEPL